MPALYVIWRGADSNDTSVYGTRCTTSLPYFEQPQTLISPYGGILQMTSRASMVALSDRILEVAGFQDGDSIIGRVSFIGTSYMQTWPHFNFVGTGDTRGSLPQGATDWTPGLATWGTGALAVWNGIGGDTRLWCSQYNESTNTWGPQYLTKIAGTGKPVQSGSAPAIINFNGTLLMVWRGEGSNDSLYFATSTDGLVWQGNIQIAGAASTIQPALAIFKNRPVLCFRGGTNDDSIHSATYTGGKTPWTAVVKTGAFGTANGPSLAVFQGQLFMTWGGANDTGLYWSVTDDNLNPSAWSPQRNLIPEVASYIGPSAVVF